jgi:hypothetical protein
MRQAEREIEQGFARLRAVPDDLPISLLDLIEKWPAEDQLTMLRARIKKTLNPGTQRRTPQLFDYTDRETWALEQFPYPLTTSPVLREIAARQRQGEFSLPKGVLKRTMKSKMKSLFGKPVYDSGGEVTYLTHIGGATVYTELDFGTRRCQVRYTHRLLPRVCDTTISLVTGEFALFCVSLMTLAGAGETHWSYLTPEDIPAAVELLGQLCVDFVESVPRILDEARTVMS